MTLAPRDPATGLTSARLADEAIARREAPAEYPTSREWAAAISIRRMCEEALYFTALCSRWVSDDDNFKLVCAEVFVGLPGPVRMLLEPWVRGQVYKSVHAQGTARHSPEDVISLAKEMLDAVEAHLSDGRRFLTGNLLTDEDMIVFHFLEAQFRTATRSDAKQYVLRKCPQIIKFTERIRAEVYPAEAAAAPDMSDKSPLEGISAAIEAFNRREAKKSKILGVYKGPLAPMPEGDDKAKKSSSKKGN